MSVCKVTHNARRLGEEPAFEKRQPNCRTKDKQNYKYSQRFVSRFFAKPFVVCSLIWTVKPSLSTLKKPCQPV